MVDLTAEYVEVRDESMPQRDGSIARWKKLTFYLGKFGPFVERFTLDEFERPGFVQTRLDTIRRHLQSLPS